MPHKISDYMTPLPYTIGEDIPLNEAIQKMKEHRIRHLPVLKGGALVGVLSDRDIHLVLSIHPNPTDLKVGDVMTDGAYAVTEDSLLDAATEVMFSEKYGCVIVTNESGKTIGIFTANDALDVLTRTLRGTPKEASSQKKCCGSGNHKHH